MKQLRCQLRDSVPPVELSLRDAPRTLSVYEDRYHDTRSLRRWRLHSLVPTHGRTPTRTPRPRDSPPSHPVSRILAICRRRWAACAIRAIRLRCAVHPAAAVRSRSTRAVAPRAAWLATRTQVDGCSPPREVRLGLLVMADAAAEQTPEQVLQAKLTERLQAQFVSAADLSDGCGSKFQCVIISALFEGKPLLVRNTPRLTSPTHILKSGGLLGSGTPSAGQRSPEGGDGGAHAPRRVSSAMTLCCAST